MSCLRVFSFIASMLIMRTGPFVNIRGLSLCILLPTYTLWLDKQCQLQRAVSLAAST